MEFFFSKYPIFLGQLLSPLLALSGVAAQLLAQNLGVSLPCLQNAFVYAFLAILYMPSVMCGSQAGTVNPEENRCLQMTSRSEQGGEASVLVLPAVENRDERDVQRSVLLSDNENNGDKEICKVFGKKTLKYGIISLLDVQANVLVTLAYRYTTLTSVMLLDCFTIPFVMCLSGCFMGTKYSTIHFVGVSVCLFGLVLIVISDGLSNEINNKTSDTPDMPTRVMGDVLCIVAAFCYAVSNVAQEKIIKEFSREEFLGMIGSWGAFIALVQSLIFENWDSIDLNDEGIMCFALYVFVIVAYYILVSKFLLYHDAAFMNISILTSDVWGIAFGYFIFHQNLHWLYFAGFFTVISGAYVYNKQAVLHTQVDYNHESVPSHGEEDTESNVSGQSITPEPRDSGYMAVEQA